MAGQERETTLARIGRWSTRPIRAALLLGVIASVSGCAAKGPGPAPVIEVAKAEPSVPRSEAPRVTPRPTGGRVAASRGYACVRTGDRATCRKTGTGPALGLAGELPTSLDHVASIGAGGAHLCALEEDGKILCWGHNEYGELGDGSTKESVAPREVVDVPRATRLAVGHELTCALFVDDVLRCTGGVGGARRMAAVPTDFQGRVVSLTAGFAHGCAALDDGTVWCWTARDRAYGRATKVAGLSDVVEVSAGSHTCARKKDGSVWCWGVGANGQLGRVIDEGSNSASEPRPVPGVDQVAQVSAGPYHTCVRHDDRRVTCWGGSSNRTPSRFLSAEHPDEIASGYDGVCGVTSKGELVCEEVP